jgi:hypothetical protein
MGISISGPSTQIPTNVVEVGNEITQNQLNAITASQAPSSGNPFQTFSAIGGAVSAYTIHKVDKPTSTWNHPFPVGSFMVALQANNNVWYPMVASGTILGSAGNDSPIYQSYDFSFYDSNNNWIPLNNNNGSVYVGSNGDYYIASGNFNGQYSVGQATQYVSANGPNYISNDWNGYIESNSFYDFNANGGMGGTMYRYVYHNGSGGFYTADNQNNPPY